MKKLTLVTVYLLGVKFSFFVYMNYDFQGELDLKNLDLTQIHDSLKVRLKTERSLHPVINVGSLWIYPNLRGNGKSLLT